jgi:hypothetical protein
MFRQRKAIITTADSTPKMRAVDLANISARDAAAEAQRPWVRHFPMNTIRWFPAIPIALGVVAGVLFLLQGGFGGGHGDYDRTIGLLAMPCILVTALFPVWPGDFLGAVLLPAIMNFGVWYGIMRLARIARISRRT